MSMQANAQHSIPGDGGEPTAIMPSIPDSGMQAMRDAVKHGSMDLTQFSENVAVGKDIWPNYLLVGFRNEAERGTFEKFCSESLQMTDPISSRDMGAGRQVPEYSGSFDGADGMHYAVAYCHNSFTSERDPNMLVFDGVLLRPNLTIVSGGAHDRLLDALAKGT